MEALDGMASPIQLNVHDEPKIINIDLSRAKRVYKALLLD